MEIYIMFVGWKIQYCQNQYTPQGNLLIQCNLNQTTNGIFHRTRTKKNLKICMETQKTRIAKAILRKKEDQEESGSLASDYTTKLQSSKQYGTGTK